MATVSLTFILAIADGRSAMLKRLSLILSGLTLAFRNLGFVDAIRYLTKRTWLACTPSSQIVTLTSKLSLHPLYCRGATSDLAVFNVIFIDREYRGIEELTDVKLVIDCGANVGFSSAFFLSHFPDCEIIAIEPDESNFQILKANLKPFGQRATTLLGAVWNEPTRLKLSNEIYRDGLEWSRQVVNCASLDEESVQAFTIDELLSHSSQRRISLLKIDIEGAEGIVFGAGCENWLPKVDNLVIELHDDTHFGNCSSIFFKAIEEENFDVTTVGELTICRRMPSH